jgi:phosphoheptose isomerase
MTVTIEKGLTKLLDNINQFKSSIKDEQYNTSIKILIDELEEKIENELDQNDDELMKILQQGEKDHEMGKGIEIKDADDFEEKFGF